MNLEAVYVRLKRDDAAIEHYQRLIHDVPTSKHLALAYLAIGDIRFASGDWQGADKSYSMVISLASSRLTTCALYKEAWTNFRRGFPMLARKAFEACRGLQHSLDGVESVSSACSADAKSLRLTEN